MTGAVSGGWSGATLEARDMVGSLGRPDATLAAYSTYRVGGPAAFLVDVNSMEDLATVSSAVRATGVRTLVVGRGSNLLVADRGFDGAVLRLGSKFEEITIEELEPGQPEAGGELTVRAGGAALLPVVARKTVQAGVMGFAWAVGVPGTIGGAVTMNAGGHGSDMAGSLQRAGVYDLAEGLAMELEASDLGLSYRKSTIKPTQVVTWAELSLRLGDASELDMGLTDIVSWRRHNQPGGQNAGSVFRNPPGDSAGRLIEAVGLKGHRLGTAQVSEKHANFIQADPDGSAEDVRALITLIRDRVLENTGIELRVENRLVGFSSEDAT